MAFQIRPIRFKTKIHSFLIFSVLLSSFEHRALLVLALEANDRFVYGGVQAFYRIQRDRETWDGEKHQQRQQ